MQSNISSRTFCYAGGFSSCWQLHTLESSVPLVFTELTTSVVPGEYGLMFLLAMGMMFVLLLANGNAQFGHSRIMQPPWPQPRQDVPGWAALHLSYIDKIAQASTNQVSWSLVSQPYYWLHCIAVIV